MEDGTTDTMRVSFPASDDFARIGRVAIAGLALRLEIDVQRVENLRLAVDEAVKALQNSGSSTSNDHRIAIDAAWEPGLLNLTLTNLDANIAPGQQGELSEALGQLVDEVDVEPMRVDLRLRSASAGELVDIDGD